MCSVVSDSLQPQGLAPWAPLSMGFPRQEYWAWIAIPFCRGSSQPRDQNPFLLPWQVGSLPAQPLRTMRKFISTRTASKPGCNIKPEGWDIGLQYFRAQNGSGLGLPGHWSQSHHPLALPSYAGHFSACPSPLSACVMAGGRSSENC